MELTNRTVSLFPAILLVLASAVCAYSQAGAISGTVIDRDGKPMAGAIIAIDRKEITQHLEVRTDGKGAFFRTGIENGTYRLTVIHDGVPVAAADNLKVSFGDRLEHNFDLRTQGTQQQPRAAGAPPADRAQREAENIANIETQGAFNAGLAALNARNFDEAIAQLSLAAERRPNMPVILARLAETYSEARKYNEAAETYKKAIELKPADIGYHDALYLALCRAGRIDECREAADKAVTLEPALGGSVFFNLGVMLAERGFVKESEEAFQRSIAHNPKNADTHYQFGLLYLRDPKTMDSAVAQFEKYLQLAPNGADAATAKQLIQAAKTSLPPGER